MKIADSPQACISLLASNAYSGLKTFESSSRAILAYAIVVGVSVAPVQYLLVCAKMLGLKAWLLPV